MAFEEGANDEEPDFHSPLPPDDRLWRHPSEVAVFRDRGPRGRSSWTAVVGAGAVGALLATGTIAVTGNLRRQVTIERPVASKTSASDTSAEVVEIAQRVQPAIIQLRVANATGGTNASGIMYRGDGHVVTNSHVVDHAASIKVLTAGGRELPARVIGSDPDTDIAVVKVDGGPFPAAALGSDAALKVGQRAIAIGAPAGQPGAAVTVGVVSALHRRVQTKTGGSMLDMIQTDARISPGASGGALLDGSGAVIGITTAAASSDAVEDGLVFATPIDAARTVADEIIATGKVVHVWLGVKGSDLDNDTAAQLGVEGGAVVDQVMQGGPADRAGIAAHDVIVALDNTSVSSMGALVVSLRSRPPGQVVSVDVVRDTKPRTMRVTLAARPGG
jgi:putative serine protease PepD